MVAAANIDEPATQIRVQPPEVLLLQPLEVPTYITISFQREAPNRYLERDINRPETNQKQTSKQQSSEKRYDAVAAHHEWRNKL